MLRRKSNSQNFSQEKNTLSNLERCLQNADRNMHTFVKLCRALDIMCQHRSLGMQVRVLIMQVTPALN